MAVKWKLRELLVEKGTNPYALARAMGDQAKAVTLYRLTSPNKKPKQISFDTLDDIVLGLRRITGKHVSVDDVLEVVDELAPALPEPALPEPASLGTEALSPDALEFLEGARMLSADELRGPNLTDGERDELGAQWLEHEARRQAERDSPSGRDEHLDHLWSELDTRDDEGAA